MTIKNQFPRLVEQFGGNGSKQSLNEKGPNLSPGLRQNIIAGSGCLELDPGTHHDHMERIKRAGGHS
jgi:hypothetical protein